MQFLIVFPAPTTFLLVLCSLSLHVFSLNSYIIFKSKSWVPDLGSKCLSPVYIVPGGIVQTAFSHSITLRLMTMIIKPLWLNKRLEDFLALIRTKWSNHCPVKFIFSNDCLLSSLCLYHTGNSQSISNTKLSIGPFQV